ncbi:MAG: alpha/beta hydrolase [Lachnospiraceae bacterium]|nr:alpha/beta hydrolase [Lachnospiraceae bacterium]
MEIQVDGLNIRYKVEGEGPKCAVILEGWGTNIEVYDSVVKDICDEYKVVTLDLPGFGQSDEPNEPWGVEEYSEFVLHFLFKIGIKEADLIGHSYGGRIIIYLASHLNDLKIGKIVLIDSAGIMPRRTPKQKRRIKLYKIKKKLLHFPLVYFFFPYMIDNWMHNQGSEDYKNATPMMKKCLVKSVNQDLTMHLKSIENDTLLVWGDLDDATPISDAHIMEENIRNSGLVVLEGTGHYSFLEKPDVFRNVIRSFMITEE